MGKCVLKGVDVTESNDSKAHIIASALGGRLKPKGILSVDGNNVLDRKVDNPHIRAMQVYMTLLDGSRDRGGAPALVPARDNNGRRYMIGADEINPLDHEYIVESIDGKGVGTIKATSMKQAKQLIGKAKKDFNLSDMEADEALKHAQRVAEDPGVLNCEIVAGPAVEFPSAFAMAALFCAHHGLPIRSDFVSYIESIDEHTQPRPLPPDTFYFIHDHDWFKLDAEMGHCLILYCDPNRKQAIFFSQLFNMLGIAVLMPYAGKDQLLHSYGVDVLEGRDVSVTVDLEMLRKLEWKETHRLGQPELYAINEKRGNSLMRIASNRQFTCACEAIWSKHNSGKDMDARMSRAERTAVYKDFRELLIRTVKLEHRQAALLALKEQFDQLGGIDE